MKNRIFEIKTLIMCILSITFFSNTSSAQEWVQLNDPPFYKHHSNGFGVDGKAYVIEGIYRNDGPNQVSKEVWEYDPTTDAWTQLADFPGTARAIAIGDEWNGKFYYGFGSSGSGLLNDLWEFDPSSGTFTQLPSCPCPGRTHPALVAHNDKVYMGSGSTFNGDLDDWWEYDMATQVWTEKPDIPGGRRHHPFHFALDKYVYVGGGHRSNWLQYDPENEVWSAIADEPAGRVAGTQFNHKGYGYVLGGDDASHVHVPARETFMRFNPQDEEWEELPELPRGSRWAPASFIIGDDLYFVGGLSDNFTDDNTMWKFDLAALDGSTPILDVAGNEVKFTAYPNPFQDRIKLDDHIVTNQSYRLKVLNLKGQTVLQIDEFNINKELDLSQVANGIYFVEISSEEGSTSIKVIKEK